MSIELFPDDRFWLHLPPAFPAGGHGDAAAWEDAVLSRMRDAWPSPIDADTETALRAALRHGRDRILPEDSVTLQFWPGAAVLNAVVHVIWGRFDEESPRPAALLEEVDDAIAEPVLAEVESTHLGAGVEARYLRRLESPTPFVVGGLTRLYSSDTHYVAVVVDATLPQLIGLLADPLAELLDTLRVVVDDDGEAFWRRSLVPAGAVPESGEAWPVVGARPGAG